VTATARRARLSHAHGRRLACVALMAAWLAGGRVAGGEAPRMLRRPVLSEIAVVRDGAPLARIVAPPDGPFAAAAKQVQDAIRGATGAAVPIVAPEAVTGERGLLLTAEARGQALLFVGNVAANRALFEPYVRRMLVADEAEPGPGACRIVTHPNPWGTGGGLVLVGSSDQAGLAPALDEFAKVVEKHAAAGKLILPRVYLPGKSDPLLAATRAWKRLARPRNEDWLKGFKKARKMHLGYSVGRSIYQFSLITDLGAFSAEELNDIENEVLENLLMFPRKVWWYRKGGGTVGGRHGMFKNPRLYLAVQHLLAAGKPNAAARQALEDLASGPSEYMDYCLAHAYRSDHEGTEDSHAWQSAAWFALATGRWGYFESGRAREAAFYGLLQTDNLGGLAGHIQYGGVADLTAPSTVRTTMTAAAWWHRDGRLRWLLEHMQLDDRTPYGFPIRLPLGDVAARRPDAWLGVQWLPVSPHSYRTSVGNGTWQQPPIPRERTADLLTFRDGFAPDDQYLCIDGFQNHLHPLGLNSVLRYADRGKLFLVAHTGKQGNYYKSGVVVSRGTQTQAEPWGAELVAAASLPRLGFAASRFHNANGCDWTRCVVWRRGAWFLFLDDLVAREPGRFNLTASWRTGSPAELTADGWRQAQDTVTFWLKPAFLLDQKAAQAPPEEYQNEVVPWLLRQTLRLDAQAKGSRTSFQNLLYATGPGDEQDFAARRVAPTACLVRGRRSAGETITELALVGLGGDATTAPGVKTDAALFYLSPELVAFADGTSLAWRGTRLAASPKAGDAEAAVPEAHRAALRHWLDALWQRSTPRPEAGEQTVRGAELKAKWAFAGFQTHAPRIAPLRTDTAADGSGWTGHFAEPTDLEKVVVVAPERTPLEEVAIEFSNDGFKADVRPAAAPLQRTTRIVGPFGKSFFRTDRLLGVAGQRARSVRVTPRKPPKAAIAAVELTAKPHVPAAITRLLIADLDGDGTKEILALTRDNQLAVLEPDGATRWQRTFEHNVMGLEPLDVDDDGKTEVVVSLADRRLLFLRPDGTVLKTLEQRTSENIYDDFFRMNRAYTMGLWRPKPGQRPNLILGTYQSVPWVTPDGRIECWPPNSDEGRYRSGYVWRGLIYWERCLPEGLDFNGDGVQDQAFVGRGWATAPSVMFFDGAKHDALAEHGIPSAGVLGLEVIRTGTRTLVLAANELHLGLYSAQGGKELWRVRFDTPAAAYALLPAADGPRIVVAKRDGVVLGLSLEGKVTGRRLLRPELTAAAPIGIGGTPHVLVGSDRGLAVLTAALKPVGLREGPVVRLASLDAATVVAAMADGTLTALAGE